MEREYFLGEVYTFAEFCNSAIRRTGMRVETARKKSASGTAFSCTYMPLKLTIANFFVFAPVFWKKIDERGQYGKIWICPRGERNEPRDHPGICRIFKRTRILRPPCIVIRRKSENAREAIKMPLKTQIQRMAHILRFLCRIYTFYFFSSIFMPERRNVQ